MSGGGGEGGVGVGVGLEGRGKGAGVWPMARVRAGHCRTANIEGCCGFEHNVTQRQLNLLVNNTKDTLLLGRQREGQIHTERWEGC